MACIITIEGNIGSGKSTLVNNLKENLDSSKYCFIQEPVDIWQTIKDSNGVDMVSKFYTDQSKYAFTFQMMAYISRLSILRKNVRENPGKILISERSLYTDKHVFCQMLYDQGKMESVEYQIYNKWFEDFIQDIPKMGIVYLKTDPQIAYDRVIKRNREGENIPLEYLLECSKYHDSWISEDTNLGLSKLVIDGNSNINETPTIVEGWAKLIEEFAILMKNSTSDKSSTTSRKPVDDIPKTDSFGNVYY